ncbi:MAG: GNAT family N-acetyltransferase [archaeon]
MPRYFKDPDAPPLDLQVGVYPPTEEVMAYIMALREEWPVDLAPLNLDVNGSPHCFLGRISEEDGIVGFVTLEPDEGSRIYRIMMMTHPDYCYQGVASVIASEAVHFARSSPDIDGLSAKVFEWGGTETVVQRLGFHIHKRRHTRNLAIAPDKLVYRLDTSGPGVG